MEVVDLVHAQLLDVLDLLYIWAQILREIPHFVRLEVHGRRCYAFILLTLFRDIVFLVTLGASLLRVLFYEV